jgi:hypothetical protein
MAVVESQANFWPARSHLSSEKLSQALRMHDFASFGQPVNLSGELL